MPSTETARLNAIADLELESVGNYTAAASVRAVAAERDALKARAERLEMAVSAYINARESVRAAPDESLELGYALNSAVSTYEAMRATVGSAAIAAARGAP